ncbi:MAG: GNAT family N-acetyltransferase [Betaproteobacteria bacterium]|jgi:hypothetical protein|nr:N-acetyltransferase [Betaproteobacteria bacterium]NBT68587.1 N-acetyltransferase [Betaproteobacteria bacterium]
MQKERINYGIRVHDHPNDIDSELWDALLALQTHPTPFMRHGYLLAVHESQSAVSATGWQAQWISVWAGEEMVAACPLYVKPHSYGEYVFDWAWARAYQQHGLDYYPKAVIAVPFTPVPGSRLLARDAQSRLVLIQAVQAFCEEQKLSSCHLLFGTDDDMQACQQLGWMNRQTVQFHWQQSDWPSFDDFLASMTQEKRKKIKQERKKVTQADVQFRSMQGSGISDTDWNFFYQCYERTYWEHGNAPYLSRDFFKRMQKSMSNNWLLFIAQKNKQDIACSLIGLQQIAGHPTVAYGRYWGALERVDCLHFEACYYQPLEWCIQNGIARFEGGAQGEHKMARALMPVMTHSAHWIADDRFANAIHEFLKREIQGVDNYMEHLGERTPFKKIESDFSREPFGS